MKKFVSMMLVLCLALAAVSCAFAANVTPVHGITENFEDDGYDCMVDVENGIDDANITFTLLHTDEYKAEDLEALQPGDTVESFGYEVTVNTVEKIKDQAEDDGYDVNGGFSEEGLSFRMSETDSNVFFSIGFDDTLSCSVGETMTLPMADQVKVSTYRMEEDGSYNGATNDATMPAAEVKAYLLKMAEGDNGIDLDSNFNVLAEDGKAVEISVVWAP